jgi:hypothetical protein
MNTRRIRVVTAAVATFVAALATALVPVGGASAEGYEHSFTGTVDKVLVNRYGGITVSGTMDCTAEVAAIYGGEENVPADTTVYVGKQWTATQYAGRGKVITASYSSGIASICYTNDPAVMAWPGYSEAPYPWSTLYGFPVGETQWVYSDNGKFGAGAIHVELTLEGSELQAGEDTHYFYDFSGWNLRATKVR